VIEPQNTAVTLRINGRLHTLEVPPHRTLLALLRGELGLTGTKECCGIGECGACTVLLNGRAVNACLVLAAEADGAEVVTIEGLAGPGRLDSLQTAFVKAGAVQCGFCIPGMILSAKYLLMNNPHPTRTEIQEGLAGNLCRCGGYGKIIDAVIAASKAED
jgi:carbon-monoxide dehydrogenase small subunit